VNVLIAEELDRLHQLITWEMPAVPSPGSVAGEACVWCHLPPGDTAVDLVVGMPRRGCADCYTTRLAWLVSWYDWHDHVRACVSCQQARTCHVGRGRSALHERTVALASQRPLRCVSCHQLALASQLVLPVLWEGTSSDHLGYGHTLCMVRRATTR